MAISGIGGIGGASGVPQPVTPGVSSASGSDKAAPSTFGGTIAQYLQQANDQHLQTDETLQKLVTGETDEVHDVVLAVAKADLAFRMVLEIRNRLIESYQEIMRMQL